MARRPGIVLLAILVVLSTGGIVCAQVQVVRAEGCCRSSCPEAQHSDPARCCKVHLLQSTAEVGSVHHCTPEPAEIATAGYAEHSLAKQELRAVTLEKIHPPPGPGLSPERLCSLQI